MNKFFLILCNLRNILSKQIKTKWCLLQNYWIKHLLLNQYLFFDKGHHVVKFSYEIISFVLSHNRSQFISITNFSILIKISTYAFVNFLSPQRKSTKKFKIRVEWCEFSRHLHFNSKITNAHPWLVMMMRIISFYFNNLFIIISQVFSFYFFLFFFLIILKVF